jgi:hypothetical protein
MPRFIGHSFANCSLLRSIFCTPRRIQFPFFVFFSKHARCWKPYPVRNTVCAIHKKSVSSNTNRNLLRDVVNMKNLFYTTVNYCTEYNTATRFLWASYLSIFAAVQDFPASVRKFWQPDTYWSCLKGPWHEIFDRSFFHPPTPLITRFKSFFNMVSNSRRISTTKSLSLCTAVSDFRIKTVFHSVCCTAISL